jgi:single-strand DNA-binding protein
MATLRLNQVVLGGNLTRDPVLRRLASGNSVAEFGLAIDDGYTSKTGEQVKQTCFVDVVAWDKRARGVHAYLHKGDCVIVVGRLTYQSWVNDKASAAAVCASPRTICSSLAVAAAARRRR